MAQLAAHFGCCQATVRCWLHQFPAAGLKSPRDRRWNPGPNAVLPNPLLEYGISNAIIPHMDKVLAKIRRNPKNVRFGDLRKVCDHYFGQPRVKGSHLLYKVPWQGEPLVNIQPVRGMAKPYQVRQVIKAIDNLEE